MYVYVPALAGAAEACLWLA
jgi:hypothetical protein